jgi:glycosyltransferase domain-containing protein
VLILDNGLEPWNAEVVSGLSDNVHYSHDAGGFYRQFRQSGELVETEYVVLVDDDNFLLDEGLEACILELERHADLIAVSGSMCNFRSWRGRVILNAPKREYIKYTLDSPDIEDRVSHKFNPYDVTGWYAVQRREVFRLIMPVVADVSEEVACAYSSEIGLEMGLAILGPTKNIPDLTVLRSLENPPENDAGHSRSLHFHTWWLDERYRHETDDFVRALKTLAPDATDTLWPLMVQELDGYSSRCAQASTPLTPRPPNFLVHILRRIRSRIRFALKLATAGLLSPKNRRQGFVVVRTATRAKIQPSADSFNVTPGLARVVTVVQRFYATSRD